jgi:membrane fusion protein, copper/silver efflux system
MIAPTITPLHKHRGQNGVIVALAVLVAAVVVVMTTQPKPAPQVADPPPRKLSVVAPAAATIAPTVAPSPPMTVARTPASATITAPAVVTLDEYKTARVMAPVAGWLDKVQARQGRRVRAGETLATMYSVEVYLAELDLVAQVQQFTTQEQLDIARRRLLRWAMRPDAVRRIELTGVATKTLPLIAPKDGIIVETTALQGLYLTPGQLFTLTDPKHVWVIASFAEGDAARIDVGTPAHVKVDGIAKPFPTKVAYIYRGVEDGVRRVRFELAAKLAPGTPATITIDR